MEITQKTETDSKNEQASEEAEHTRWGKEAGSGVSELWLIAVPRAATPQRAQGSHAWSQVSPWFQKDQLCPVSTPCYSQLPPSTTSLQTRSGKGEQAEDTAGTSPGLPDGTPQEGHGWHASLTGWRQGLPSLGIRVVLPTGGHGLVRSSDSQSGPSRDSH